MLKVLVGVFIVLHGLVHLLYFGQSQRFFELQPGMVWPDGSWAFSKLLGDETIRLLGSASCVLAALGFVVGGIGVLVNQHWWRSPAIVASVLSSMAFILLWNGRMQKVHDQGAIGVLINVAIVVAALIVQWPV